MNADQQALVGLALDVMAGRCANEQLAAVEQSSSRVDEALWRELAGAGLVGIAVPEPYGGAGLGLAELCLLAEAQGRRLAPVPLPETSLAALALAAFAPADVCAQWLPGVADGTVRLASTVDVAGGPVSVHAQGASLSGHAPLVAQGHVADALLVAALDPTGDLGLYLVEASAVGLARSSVVRTDHSMASDLVLDGVGAVRLGGAEAVAGLADRTRLGLAALLLGLADEGVREAAAYLSGREQFGRPLATFQATTQQLGDCYCDVQAMRAVLWQAVWALEHDPASARRSVDAATWWAADAGQRVQHVVQHLHGGIGADTTYPVHRRLLWTMRAVAELGGASRQLVRLGKGVLTA